MEIDHQFTGQARPLTSQDDDDLTGIWISEDYSQLSPHGPFTGYGTEMFPTDFDMTTGAWAELPSTLDVQSQEAFQFSIPDFDTCEVPLTLPLPLETNQPQSLESQKERQVQFIVNSDQPHRIAHRQHKPEVWDSLKATIKGLYIDQDKTLEELSQIMKQRHGFQAT